MGNAGYTITGTSGTDQTGLDFANFELFDLSGTKYTDLTGDGITDDDTPLSGVTIFIDHDGSGTLNAGDLQTTTAADGTWSINNLDYSYAGDKVYEVLPGGYTQTVGNAGYTITGTSGTDQTNLDFANFENIDISGYKWLDANHNSDWDDGEMPVSDWTIDLFKWDDASGNNDGNVDQGELTQLDTTETNDVGYYEFDQLGPLAAGEKYFVQEEVKVNALNTFGTDGYIVDPTSGNTLTGHSGMAEDGNFGNFFVSSMVTDSSLCDFGDQFRLIYTPDFTEGGGAFKLNASNPGQYYYNGFYEGDPGDTVDIVINIPYPFVTQGANPFHAYDSVSLNPDELLNDQICLVPGDEVDHGSYQISLDNYDGGGMGDSYQLIVQDVEIPDSGGVYFNLHLDYGLKTTTGYAPNDNSDTGGKDAVDGTDGNGNPVTVEDGQMYDFSHQVGEWTDNNNNSMIDPGELVSFDSGADGVESTNAFKNLKGEGGLFQNQDGDALTGQHIMVFKDGDQIGDAWSDEDGWYYAQFMATGKMTDYTVVWDENANGVLDDSDHAVDVPMGGHAGKWAQADFTVTDPSGYDPHADTPDTVIDSYDALDINIV